eukprot:c16671_g1_i1 orf=116-1294(-)
MSQLWDPETDVQSKMRHVIRKRGSKSVRLSLPILGLLYVLGPSEWITSGWGMLRQESVHSVSDIRGFKLRRPVPTNEILDNQETTFSRSGAMNVLVVGDWGRKGRFNQSQVAGQMGEIGEKLNIDFIISTGDNFYENGLSSIEDLAFDESFSQVYTAKSLQKTWHIVLGNHDYRGDTLAQLDPILRLRDSRWHCERSFTLVHNLGSPMSGDASLVQFFFIDTTPFVDKYWKSSHEPYDWRGVVPRHQYLHKQTQDLIDGLEASKATWKIVVGHHPIRSVGNHGDTAELVQTIYPILKAKGVDLYINGHDHCLEHISSRDSGIEFITSGAGSKAWRGMNPAANTDGLKFFYDGQGFLAMSISLARINLSFYDIVGSLLYQVDMPMKVKNYMAG